jgi:hypothetical protein
VCPYTHSLPARNAYEEVANTTDYGYEALLERKLRSIVRDCERRIESNQRRVEENEREKARANPHDEEISELSAEYEQLLENGELDDANKIQTKINELKSKKAAPSMPIGGLETGLNAGNEQSALVGHVIATLGSHPQYQALRVCDQCGLLLSSKEASKLDDHFIGKLHTGFVAIREKLAQVEAILNADVGVVGPLKKADSSNAAQENETKNEGEKMEEEEEVVAINEAQTDERKEEMSTQTLEERPMKRMKVVEGYEMELPPPPRRDDSRQQGRDRGGGRDYNDRDRDYNDRDRGDRYSRGGGGGKDQYRGRRGDRDRRDDRYRDSPYDDRRGRDRDGGSRDYDSHRGHRESYRDRY